ncbi:MAG TPA: ABC transporter permease, partial [Asanoa sp.]|nr:ABC transporter permease [Asanoa sp.]
NQDMQEGIIARLRTMSIARTSVLTGQVIGSLIRTLISVILVVLVALALGFRPSATPVEYLAAFGVFALLTFALTWLAVAFGLATKTVAGANSLTLILQFLPLISSAFLPTGSMPAGVAWFAEHQPYTPIIETLRGLLMGSGIGDAAWWSLGWCVVLATAGFFWARHLYDRPRGA